MALIVSYFYTMWSLSLNVLCKASLALLQSLKFIIPDPYWVNQSVKNFLTEDGNTIEMFNPQYTGLEHENSGRKRRKKSSTSSRSRHSSHNSNLDEDCESINGDIIDIHQLENEALLDVHEISDSFSIEFASPSNKGLTLPKNGFHFNVVEDSASNSIVFRHSDSSESKVGVGF